MASALAGGAALLAASATASAQDYTYLLLVDYGPGETSVHPGNPSATVRVWATLKETDWAWATGDFDLTATEAGWTDFDLVVGVHGQFGRSRGTLSADGRTVDGVLTGQFNDIFGPPAKTEHPLLIWEGTWTNMGGVYGQRTVDLATLGTTRYRVFETHGSSLSTDVLAGFEPSFGQITITPTSGVLTPLIVGLLAATRRSRAER